MDDFKGKVCINEKGRIGLVTNRTGIPWQWSGKDLSDDSWWEAKTFRVLYDSLEEYERDRHVLGIGKEYHNDKYERWTMDQAFMSMAFCMSKCSHDSNTQHGAVVVDERSHPLASGCNGWLPKSPDSLMPNTREGGFKYAHVRHAEINTLSQATRSDLSGCRIYVTGLPCNNCMSEIIARGIREVIVGDVGHVFGDGFWEMHNFLVRSHGVTVRYFDDEIVDTSKTRRLKHG
tara:strand:+ start:102314 stop:103009 length:696 start_codon:yes stop_codon:yes gene_type:complete